MQLASVIRDSERISNGSSFSGNAPTRNRNGARSLGPSARVCFLGATLLLLGAVCFAGITASISGTVHDPSGATIAGATVTTVNTETGISQTQKTNSAGFYSFPTLPLGHYDVSVQQSGFRTFRKTGIVLAVNDAIVVDANLQVGEVKEAVEVQSESLRVETVSSQMGVDRVGIRHELSRVMVEFGLLRCAHSARCLWPEPPRARGARCVG